MVQPQAVLFACGQNAIRSPMAAALLRQMRGTTLYVASAGVRATTLDPFAVAVMDEIGLDIAGHRPKTFEDLEDLEGLNFDLIVTLAPEAPYPACVQDANYGVRWLKARATYWNGDGSRVGIYGSSSGGHVAELLAMRPHDSRYNAIPLGAAGDATVSYVAMRSPVSNPFARFQNAEHLKRDAMVKNTTTFFKPWETIHESNPQEILERHEAVTLVPLLIMQGGLDDNVLPAVQQKFADSYRAAGGECDYQLFEGCEHEWVAQPGPQTDRARDMVKAFIARHLAA